MTDPWAKDPMKLVATAAVVALTACLAAYVTAVVLLVFGDGLSGLIVALAGCFLEGMAGRLMERTTEMVERRAP